MTGKITKIMAEKAYGFIKASGQEYFFHMDDCRFAFDNAYVGMDVDFEPTDSPKGLRAKDVKNV